jgi:hypothetical protein
MEKLRIVPFTVDKSGNFEDIEASAIRLMINPSSYKLNSAIEYTDNVAQGNTAHDPKFKSAGPDTLDFETIFDSTGAIATDKKSNKSVQGQIDDLKKTVYNYQGKEHQPYFAKIIWGELIFRGRLTSFSVDYKLFAPSGKALRATVKLSFKRYVSPPEEEKKKANSSPDLTHLVEVKAGDTLPLLCYKIYKDSSYYQKVAKINGLSGFRSLQPGTMLEFPPIRND